HPALSGTPTDPAPTAPADGAVVGAAALAATFNDPDAGDTGSVQFRLCSAAAAAGTPCSGLVDSGSSATVASGATPSWTPAAALAHGATYYWQAQARDALGAQSAWTATRSFVVDAAPTDPAPAAPADGELTTSTELSATYTDPDGDAGTI